MPSRVLTRAEEVHVLDTLIENTGLHPFPGDKHVGRHAPLVGPAAWLLQVLLQLVV